MKILVITDKANLTGINWHRMIMPHNDLAMNYEGVQCQAAISMDTVDDESLKDFQIVVFSRIVSDSERTKEIIDRAKKLGLKVIIDIDDYWKLHSKHEMNGIYEAKNVANQTLEGLKQADWVTTTTEHFADKIREFNTNVTVLPNSIANNDEQFWSEPTQSERVRIGWIGGIFHKEDLALVYNGFKDVWKDIKHDKFQFCLGGWNYPNKLNYIKQVVNDSRSSPDIKILFGRYIGYLEQGIDVPDKYIFNDTFGNVQQYDLIEGYMTDFLKYPKDEAYKEYLKKKVAEGNEVGINQPYTRLPVEKPNTYGTLYNSLDVSLVPLIANNFNSFKSQIKIIEAGFMKKAVIVSNVMPYTIDCNSKNSILISPSKRGEGWGAAMKSLILNPNKREDLAEAMHETVKDKYAMETVNKVRYDLYKKLCD